MMSRAKTESYLHGPRLQRAASSIMDTDVVDEDVQENWYFWSKGTASRTRDYYGSESITTVYAVKAAIGQKRCTGTLVALVSSSTWPVCCVARDYFSDRILRNCWYLCLCSIHLYPVIPLLTSFFWDNDKPPISDQQKYLSLSRSHPWSILLQCGKV